MHSNQSRRTDAQPRRGDMTTVPELMGLPAAEAHDRALDAGLLAVGRNAVHTGAGRATSSIRNRLPGDTASGVRR